MRGGASWRRTACHRAALGASAISPAIGDSVMEGAEGVTARSDESVLTAVDVKVRSLCCWCLSLPPRAASLRNVMPREGASPPA